MAFEYKLKPRIGATDMLLAAQMQWELPQWQVTYSTTVQARSGAKIMMYGVRTPKFKDGLFTIGVDSVLAKDLINMLRASLSACTPGLAGASLLLKVWELLDHIVRFKEQYHLSPSIVITDAKEQEFYLGVWDEARSIIDQTKKHMQQTGGGNGEDSGVREGGADSAELGGGGEMPSSET